MRISRFIIFVALAIVCLSCHVLDKDRNVLLFKHTPVYELAKAINDNDTAKIDYLVRVKKMSVNYEIENDRMRLLALACYNDRKLAFNKLLDLGAEVDPNPSLYDSFVRSLGDYYPYYLGVVLSRNKVSKERLAYLVNVSNDACLDTLIKYNALGADTLGVSVYSALKFKPDYKRALKLLQNGVCFNDSVCYQAYPDNVSQHTLTEYLEDYEKINPDAITIFIDQQAKKDLIAYINAHYHTHIVYKESSMSDKGDNGKSKWQQIWDFISFLI